MPHTRSFCRALAFALLFIGLVPMAAEAHESCAYVCPTTLPPTLLPPPLIGHDAERDLQAVIRAQHHLTPQDIVAMRDEQKMRLDIVTRVIGADFTRVHYPKTFELLDHVMADTQALSHADKNYWHTKRPYLISAKVKLMVDPIDSNPAYPSGHTSGSFVLAEVLGLLFPDKLADLRSRADAIAQHRIEAGVHFPSDVAAGKELGALMLGALLSNDNFQSDLDDAKEEIAAVNVR